jgi:hypothetical protein
MLAAVYGQKHPATSLPDILGGSIVDRTGALFCFSVSDDDTAAVNTDGLAGDP